MKPFKAPTVVRRTPSNTQQPVASVEPPSKKRRISDEVGQGDVAITAAAANILKTNKPMPKFQTPAARKPLAVVENPSSSLSNGSQGRDAAEGYYTVLW